MATVITLNILKQLRYEHCHRIPICKVSGQVNLKPDCIATQASSRFEILDLDTISAGINKGADQPV